jgi:hypothetical protein
VYVFSVSPLSDGHPELSITERCPLLEVKIGWQYPPCALLYGPRVKVMLEVN